MPEKQDNKKNSIKLIRLSQGWVASAGYRNGQRIITAPTSKQSAIEEVKKYISNLEDESQSICEFELLEAPDVFVQCSKCQSSAKQVGEILSGPWFVDYNCGSYASWNGQLLTEIDHCNLQKTNAN